MINDSVMEQVYEKVDKQGTIVVLVFCGIIIVLTFISYIGDVIKDAMRGY